MNCNVQSRIKKDASQIYLRDIYQKFPLQGQYYFRFKSKTKDGIVSWVDIRENDRVQCFKGGRVFMKVVRISWEDSSKDLHILGRVPDLNSASPT